MSDLPNGWDVCSLGELGVWSSGGTPSRTNKDFFGGPIRWIKSGDLPDGPILRTDESITELALEQSAAKLLPVNTICIALYGATIGKLGITTFPAATNQAVANLILNSDLINVRYVFYFLKSARSYFVGLGQGGAQPNISQQIVRETKIRVAPLKEQKRIAEKLDSLLSRVDSCRERLDRVPAILRRFRQSVLAAATSGKLTEEWRIQSKSEADWEHVTLADVATEFSYGSSAKSSKFGRIPVLRMGNIKDGQLDWEELVYTSNNDEIKKYRLEPGDVLFNRTNSPELVGKTAVYDGQQPAIYAGYLIKVRCGDRVLPEYLNYCLNSPAGKDYCWKVKSDGVSQSNINAKKLAAFRFLLPQLEEQRQIVQQVEALFARASQISNYHSAAASRLEQLQKSTLAKAFRGELIPQDPINEPASVLLEQIREMKGQNSGESKKKGISKMTRTTRKSNGQIRQLTSVLQENNGVMTPEKLLDAAGYTDESIEDFYLVLKKCIADGAILDPRDHDNQIVLVQAQT